MSSDSRDNLSAPAKKKPKLDSIITENDKQVLERVKVAQEQIFMKQLEEMRNELKCGICHEEFIAPTTLNCSHTFCNYCITMWKKKKKNCPICQVPITSECRSLIIDSFVAKIMETQPEEVKRKRQELIQTRRKCNLEVGRELSRKGSRESDNFATLRNSDSVDALFRFLRYVRCPECGETIFSDFDIESDLSTSDTNLTAIFEPDPSANETDARPAEESDTPQANPNTASSYVAATETNANSLGKDTVLANVVLNATGADTVQSPAESNQTT